MAGLMRMLKRIQATLHDAERREITDKSVQLWLTELRDVAYAADDVIDEWRYDQLEAQLEARNSSKGNPHKRKLIEIPEGLADQIKNIRRRFDEISKDRVALQLREEDGVRISNSASYPILTSHLVIESSIFGREREKEEVISCLMSHCCQKKFTVLPIVGMGGLGKTTLAQLVYNDTRVQRQFDILGWVCVSNDFNVVRITKALLESLTKGGCDLTELSTLQEELKSTMAGKNVFLVLDDVWNEHHSYWETLKAPFESAKNISILVTTRNESVAHIVQTVHFFKLGVLSDEQSWQLFQHYAFGDFPDIEHSNLAKLGRKIVSKCSGLPLAIKIIASLLRYEAEEERWMKLLKSEIWEEYPNSEIFAALRISYMQLPEYLKSCLLFCSMFPKDHKYRQNNLINLWCAHDYILPREKKTIGEVGKEYVKELRQRSFLEQWMDWLNWRDVTYKIHDMVHDMLCLISKNAHCELHDDSPIKNMVETSHHLYINGHSNLLVRHVMPQQLAVLRTLIISYKDGQINENYLSNAHRSRALEIFVPFKNRNCSFDLKGQFKHMRHLVLSRYTGDLKPIWQFLNLRSLSINMGKLEKLPKRITNLANLTSLSLSDCEFKILPEYFFFLTNLEKLYLKGCENLQDLPESLGKLVNLRELEIYHCPFQALPDSLCELKKLQILKFERTAFDVFELEGRPTRLPEAIGTLSCLHELFIYAHINHLPSSFNKIYKHSRSTMLRRVVVGKNCGIGWLKYFRNLKGTLYFDGLRNLVNLDGVRRDILVAMYNLEELVLSWSEYRSTPMRKHELSVHIKKSDTKSSEEMNFSILDNLQPHRNLKKLTLNYYQVQMLPMWVGNPIVCASLQTIRINNCWNLNSLPFGNLCSLREFVLDGYSSFSSLHENSLPSQLEKLHIVSNDNLVSMPVLPKLISLVELIISYCSNLKPHVVGTDYEANWSPPASCNVHIKNCPMLIDWCIQHDIAYEGPRRAAS